MWYHTGRVSEYSDLKWKTTSSYWNFVLECYKVLHLTETSFLCKERYLGRTLVFKSKSSWRALGSRQRKKNWTEWHFRFLIWFHNTFIIYEQETYSWRNLILRKASVHLDLVTYKWKAKLFNASTVWSFHARDKWLAWDESDGKYMATPMAYPNWLHFCFSLVTISMQSIVSLVS